MLDTLKLKLEELYSLLSEISPLDSVDPFLSNTLYSSEILETLSCLLNKATLQKDSLLKENQYMKELLQNYSRDLQEEYVLDNLNNILLEREFLVNEINRMEIKREELGNRIERIKNEIITLQECINEDCFVDVDGVTVDNLRKLESKKGLLMDKVSLLESKRQLFYDEIEEYSRKLSVPVAFSYEENILDLKRDVDAVKKRYLDRLHTYNTLLEDIRKKEGILNMESRDFDVVLDSATLSEMNKYDVFLKEEQIKHFDEIFNRALAELSEIKIVLGQGIHEYPRTEEGLVSMRNEIERLYPIRNVYIEIVERIQKRKNLLEKMTEFEKIASDPKRLFKSSFQLNSEEKFRNSAYPSLLKMEEELFEIIDRFEGAYGEFEYEGGEYKEALRKEIENRIINRTVFISRSDTPHRKKK